MKKIALIIFVLIFWSSDLKAQMHQGTWMLEGNVGLGRSRIILPEEFGKLDPQSSYTLHPRAGIFIKDNLAIGISGLFGNSWSKNKDADLNSPFSPTKMKTFRIGGGAFIRKYKVINDQLSFFGEIGSDISWEKYIVKYVKSGQNTERDNGRTFQAQGTLGLQYLISSKVGVHLQTNLLQYQNAQDLPAEFKEFRVGFLIEPRFGLTIFL
jgi:hypothetical protein